MTMRIHGDKIEFPDGTEQFTASSGGDVEAQPPVAFEVKASEKQYFTTGVEEKLIFGTTKLDTDNAFDSTNNHYVAPRDGIMQINAGALLTSDTGNVQQAFFYLYKNNVEHIHSHINNRSLDKPNDAYYLNSVIEVKKGDILEIRALIQGTDILSNSTHMTYFSGHMVSSITEGEVKEKEAVVFKGLLSADQTGVATNSWTKLNLAKIYTDSTGKKYGNESDIVDNEFKPSVAGWYLINAGVSNNPNVVKAQRVIVGVRKNDTWSFTGSSSESTTTVNGAVSSNASDIIYLDGKNDSLRLVTLVTATKSATISSENFNTYLSAHLITGQSSGGGTGGGETTPAKAPEVMVLKDGSGTYTTPKGALYLTVKMCGAGGGGSGAGGGGGLGFGAQGVKGGNSTFGSSLLTCNGGIEGSPAGGASAGGAGGTAINNAVGIALQGGSGSGPTVGSADVMLPAMSGGVNAFGGNNSKDNLVVTANTGAGGWGGNSTESPSIGYTGTGGGAGGYIEATITSPLDSYSYEVGTGGAGGVSGSTFPATVNGGKGSDGIIIVTAHFGATGTGGSGGGIDYEEGEYDAELKIGDTVNATVKATYSRIGNQVTLHIPHLGVVGKTGTGDVSISTPFKFENNSTTGVARFAGFVNLGTSATVAPHGSSGNSFMHLQSSNADGYVVAKLTDGHCSTNFSLYTIDITYKTSGFSSTGSGGGTGGGSYTPEKMVWEDKTAEREVGKTYTNTNDVPLYVQLCSFTPGLGASETGIFKIDDVSVGGAGSNAKPTSEQMIETTLYIIPAGSKYEFSSLAGEIRIDFWQEARMPVAIGTGGKTVAFRGEMSANQTVTTAVGTKVNIAEASIDTDNALTDGKFMPSVAGYYQISGSLYSSSNPHANRIISEIHRNGIKMTEGSNNTVERAYISSVSELVYLNGTTDYIELYGKIFGNGTCEINKAPASTFLSAVLVSGGAKGEKGDTGDSIWTDVDGDAVLETDGKKLTIDANVAELGAKARITTDTNSLEFNVGSGSLPEMSINDSGDVTATGKIIASNNLGGYNVDLMGQGISYAGVTVGGGSGNRIAFRWASPKIVGVVDNSAVVPLVVDSELKAVEVEFDKKLAIKDKLIEKLSARLDKLEKKLK